MNSGKYLYKIAPEKKSQIKKVNVSDIYIIFQKPQFKYITNETISHFKKFISKLYMKEEEALLNKKKKREENKQKNKFEKNKINKNNGMNQYNYYSGLYMTQMQQINNQNPPPYYGDYQNNLYYFNSPYQIHPQVLGMPPFFQQLVMEPPKNLQENLNNIYNRGIVNNIIGAFFIKECQEKKKNIEKRRIPVSTVNLGDDQSNNNITVNSNNSTLNNNIENSPNNERNESLQNQLTFAVNEQNNKSNITNNNNSGENKGDNYEKNESNLEKNIDSE